jgi:hypothetical protein
MGEYAVAYWHFIYRKEISHYHRIFIVNAVNFSVRLLSVFDTIYIHECLVIFVKFLQLCLQKSSKTWSARLLQIIILCLQQLVSSYGHVKNIVWSKIQRHLYTHVGNSIVIFELLKALTSSRINTDQWKQRQASNKMYISVAITKQTIQHRSTT